MGNDAVLEQIFSLIMSNTDTSGVSTLILVGSLSLNYYLYNGLKSIDQRQQDYEMLFKKLSPLLAKIIDGESLTKTEKEDLSNIRNIINFQIIK